MVNSGPTAFGAAGWNTIAITPTTLAADTTYWIAYNSSGSNDNVVFSGNDTGPYAVADTVAFGSAPHSWPGSEFTVGPGYLFYATLEGPTNPTPITRTIDYTYDGLQRLTGAVESPGSSFAYRYDLAGNRTGVTVDGTAVRTDTYDAADQVVGWTYDGAGNLTSDGTTSYSYKATNDLTGTTTTGQSRAYVYNGDGTLVGQTVNGTTTNYTQDLAADQPEILAGTVGLTSTDYQYGQDML